MSTPKQEEQGDVNPGKRRRHKGEMPKDAQIVFRGISTEWKFELMCIASHEGITLGDFLRSKLNGIRLAYPDHKRKNFNHD